MSIEGFLTLIYNNNWVRAIGALIIGNVVLGLAIAIMHRDFQFYLGDMANFLQTKIIPYLLGYGVAKIVILTSLSEYAASVSVLEGLISGVIIASLVGKLLEQFKIIFPALPIPTWMTSKPKPETQATP
jgi:NO-binding membrane sensor protein with MHYT domain